MYVRGGLFWEEEELEFARRFLDELAHTGVQPLRVFDVPLRDLYGDHWSLTGQEVPAAGTPDEDVYLPGRNPLLLLKPAIACVRFGIGELALATLAANPFSDATPEFLDEFSAMIAHACGGQVRITQPYAHLQKHEVLQRAPLAPLHLALSCLQPVKGKHCGACNKCGERRAAFHVAAMPDKTVYAIDLR